jgi:hypothetical protein
MAQLTLGILTLRPISLGFSLIHCQQTRMRSAVDWRCM